MSFMNPYDDEDDDESPMTPLGWALTVVIGVLLALPFLLVQAGIVTFHGAAR